MSLKDIFGEAQAEMILDDLGDAVEQLKRLGWKEQRPWPEFFSVFKPPEWTANALEQRLATNLLYYRTNYLIISAGFFLIACIVAPIVVASLFAVMCFCALMLVVLKGPLVIGELRIQQREKAILIILVSVLFLFFTGAMVKLLWAVFASIVVCLAHMVFRPRNVHSKMNKQYEEWKMSGFSLGHIGSDEFPKAADPEAAAEPSDEAEGFASSRVGAAAARVRQRGRR